MKNFNWSLCKQNNIAVHCDTLEKAIDFLKQCNDRNIKWFKNGDPIKNNYWDHYTENTCYNISYNNQIYYSDINYYKKAQYNFIKWEIENGDKMKFNWENFKQGKFVVRINEGNRNQFIKEIKKECKNINLVNFWRYDSEYYEIKNNKINPLGNYELNKSIVDFVLNKNIDNYEIYITSDGIRTNCVYKLNGKIVNKSNAKLNPIDEFDFKEGAKICIDRVFEEEKKIIKKGTKFKVLNTNCHISNKYVCLDAYIGQIGTFNYDCNFEAYNLSSGTFEKEYVNAIDKENGCLIWHQSEVEILLDNK